MTAEQIVLRSTAVSLAANAAVLRVVAPASLIADDLDEIAATCSRAAAATADSAAGEPTNVGTSPHLREARSIKAALAELAAPRCEPEPRALRLVQGGRDSSDDKGTEEAGR